MDTWPPARTLEKPLVRTPSWGVCLARGLAMRCPACGRASAFNGFVTVRQNCPNCGAPLGRVRLELAPSYLTIIIGLFVMGAIMFLVQNSAHLRLPVFVAIFIPACVAFELLLVRPLRGLFLAMMLKLNVVRAPDELPQGG